MEWFDGIISMRPTKGLTTEDFHAMEEQWHVQVEESLFGEDWLKCCATEIIDAKYEWTDVKGIVDKLDYLIQNRKDDLLALLQRMQPCLAEFLVCTHTRSFIVMLI